MVVRVREGKGILVKFGEGDASLLGVGREIPTEKVRIGVEASRPSGNKGPIQASGGL